MSADPDLEDTDLLPCFATFRPKEATTKLTAVEILRVFKPSPPVPQTSKISPEILIFFDLLLKD